MKKPESSSNHRHDPAQCARAWVALQAAHARVAASLAKALAAECDLTISEFDVLVHLSQADPGSTRLSDLCPAVQLSQPALSRLITRLEQRGLVQRGQSSDDRRAVPVHLTDAGHALLDRATPIHAACIHDALTGWLTEEEQRLLITALTRPHP